MRTKHLMILIGVLFLLKCVSVQAPICSQSVTGTSFDPDDSNTLTMEQRASLMPIKNRICTDDWKIYLSFEGGLNSYTKEVLDILDTLDVEATFFIPGYSINQYPKEVSRIRQTHTFGYAGWDNMELTYSNYKEQLKRTYPFSCFRPRNGHIDKEMVDYSTSLGMPVYAWSLDPQDLLHDRNPKEWRKTALFILTNTHKGAIIRLHHTQSTVRVLEAVIPILKEEGWEFEKL